jgi:hypothetical protein
VVVVVMMMVVVCGGGWGWGVICESIDRPMDGSIRRVGWTQSRLPNP